MNGVTVGVVILSVYLLPYGYIAGWNRVDYIKLLKIMNMSLILRFEHITKIAKCSILVSVTQTLVLL